MRVEDINIGTSGWKFADWAGVFYPMRVPQSRWLEYYAARFSIGEINSTYYSIGGTRSFAGINSRTPDEFRLFVKAHADVTHARTNPQASLQKLMAALTPLRESKKLLGILAQFPGSFRACAENVRYVMALKPYCEEIKMCVEFRHRSWDTLEIHDHLRAADLTWVCPDEPQMENLLPFRLQATAEVLYIRLHGRNSSAWYNSSSGDRYDYNYSAEELTSFANTLLTFNTPSRKVYLLFNNCHSGQAPANALWLKDWLASRETGVSQKIT
jgi:uncharacterized protein YecE (DUF72 family)